MRDGTLGMMYPIRLGNNTFAGGGERQGGASNWSVADYKMWQEAEAKRIWEMEQRRKRQANQPRPQPKPQPWGTNMPGVNMPGTNMPGLPGNQLFDTPPSWSNEAPLDQGSIPPGGTEPYLYNMPGVNMPGMLDTPTTNMPGVNQPGTNMPGLPGTNMPGANARPPARRYPQYTPFYNQLFGQGYF